MGGTDRKQLGAKLPDCTTARKVSTNCGLTGLLGWFPSRVTSAPPQSGKHLIRRQGQLPKCVPHLSMRKVLSSYLQVATSPWAMWTNKRSSGRIPRRTQVLGRAQRLPMFFWLTPFGNSEPRSPAIVGKQAWHGEVLSPASATAAILEERG